MYDSRSSKAPATRARTRPSAKIGPETSASIRPRFQLPATAATEAANSRVGALRSRLTVAEGSPEPVTRPVAPRTTSTRS